MGVMCMSPMRRFPTEFADLLSPQGRKAFAGKTGLAGALANPRTRFLHLPGLMSRATVAGILGLLERRLGPHLVEMSEPVPPEIIGGMRRNNDDWLPKVMRVRTAYLENRREAAFSVAEDIGLTGMMNSESFVAFAEMLAGRQLSSRRGAQVIAYGAGDYTGPHTDHYPELKAARAGYLDVHLSFANSAVATQSIVYAKAGHFTEVADMALPSVINAYRLPFWHYVTPLQAKRGQAARARRWLLLGTFLYKDGKGR